MEHETVSQEEQGSAPQSEQLLDPFDFHIGVASRIAGLGGPNEGYEPNYAFHTPYVEAEPGFATFTLRFTGLKATRGTLQLWLNMLPSTPGSNARVANSERFQLNRLIAQRGEASIRFESFRGVKFALHGQIVDETDASAEALVVALDRPRDPNVPETAGIEARSSTFGAESVRPVSHIISIGHATMETPISQMCTAAQLREHCFIDWIKKLDLEDEQPLDQWKVAYAMRVLDRYGFLKEGARGLVIGASGPVPAALAQRGIHVTAIGDLELTEDDEPAGKQALSRPAICDPDRFADLVDYRLVRRQELPAQLLNFDFMLCDDIAARFATIADGTAFVEQTMGHLRPGGLAVHLLPFDPIAQGHNRESAEAVVFRARDIERIALILISRRLDAAQISADSHGVILRQPPDKGEEITSHGLIARRPPTAF